MFPKIVHEGCFRDPSFGWCPLVTDLAGANLIKKTEIIHINTLQLLSDKGCFGAPDWIVEIVSPGRQRMDYYIKLFKYRTAGVCKYGIVDPEKKHITVYDFESENTRDIPSPIL